MTLIVAHVSATGAVMASDSLAVEADYTISQEKKIWSTGGLLFGYAGQLSLREDLRKAIEAALVLAPIPPDADLDMVKSQLTAIIAPALRTAYGNYVGSGDPENALGGALLVVGKSSDGHWILEIDKHNTPSDYTQSGFHAIGSAAENAHVARYMLRHHVLPGRETKHLRLVALRTVASCVEVLGHAFGIGLPVQLWHNVDNGFAELDENELAGVQDGVEQWIQIEKEALDKVFADSDDGTKEPLPDRLTDT